ncbi:hypothetical protein SLS62_005436 [Diatrype stigma]|uniref:Uncharacterized protein n=1 Tax=Diatrype stigma TaxID=117547 RepID=A0AAN9UT53_9PEZI
MCFFGTDSDHQRGKHSGKHSEINTRRKKQRALGKSRRKDHQRPFESSYYTPKSGYPSPMAYKHFHPMAPMNGMAPHGPTSPGPNSGPGYSTPTFPEVYIPIRSASQIRFPVVDFNPKKRPSSQDGPVYYMAMAPSHATPEDIEAALAPPGSGLAVLARLPDFKTSSLSAFRDASDIRCHSLQLEISEEAPPSAGYYPSQSGEKSGYGPYNNYQSPSCEAHG